MQIKLALILAFLVRNENKNLIIISLITITLLSAIISYKAYNSMKDQMILLSEFNSNNFVANQYNQSNE